MYRPQPVPAGAPWAGGPPPPGPGHHHQQFEYDPYSSHQTPWHAPPPPMPPGLAPGLSPQHHRVPGGSRAQGDELSFRLKEEQRRKQAEYSQALAAQVQQRDQQKQHEKELRRREDAVEPGAAAVAYGGHPQRGLFDGLGQNNPSQRANFGRGRRDPSAAAVPPSVAAATHTPQALHSLAGSHSAHHEPESFHHHQAIHAPPPGPEQWGFDTAPSHPGWAGHHTEPPTGGFTPRQQEDGPWMELPAAHHQQIQQQPQQPGRRMRTDLLTNGDVPARHRQQQQQQQLDMQDALRRQIEDKQRLKMEEKRQREDDERREIQKFEMERQRQQQEQDRVKEDKRKKALAEEEHFKIQQLQLEAANAAAARDQKLLKDRLHHHNQNQNQNQSPLKAAASVALRDNHMLPMESESSQQVVVASQQAGLVKDPFANSRAHLFRDPTPPPQQHQHQQQQRQAPVPPHQQQQHHQQPLHHPSTGHMHTHGGYETRVAPVDTRVLLEQYEQMRQELQQQRELVEQVLHAQQQQQQQQQNNSRHPIGEIVPTISDLDRLRQELREELAQKEHQRRQEMDALRRRHHHQDQQQESPHQQQRAASSPLNQHQQSSSPIHHGSVTGAELAQRRSLHGPHRRQHDAFVQDALDEEEEEEQELRGPEIPSDEEEEEDEPELSNQRVSHELPSRHPQLAFLAKTSQLQSSTASLACESRLVFFDGRVHQHPPSQPLQQHNQARISTVAERSSSGLDDSVDELLVQQLRRSNQETSRSPPSPPQKKSTSKVVDPKEDDSLGFFVKTFDGKEPVPSTRYSTSRSESMLISSLERERASSSRSPQGSIGSRLAAVLPVDEEEEDDENDLDESLDGDQLDAIFQRNVRRHEILTSFEVQSHHQQHGEGAAAPAPLHWAQLHQLLQNVPSEVEKAKLKETLSTTKDESSLVTSSRWMPSSALQSAAPPLK